MRAIARCFITSFLHVSYGGGTVAGQHVLGRFQEGGKQGVAQRITKMVMSLHPHRL